MNEAVKGVASAQEFVKLTDQQSANFWAKVAKRGPNECWRWVGNKTRGYGTFKLNRRRIATHRVMWNVTRGSIPRGLMVCHKCDNPPCCNPHHLFLGTQFDNMGDASRKGRCRGPKLVGMKHPKAKLTDDDVRSIRKEFASGSTNLELRRKYKVSASSIRFIVKNQTWTHLL